MGSKKNIGSNKITGQQISLVQKNIILVHKNLDPEKFGPKSLVKIRSETAEILLIQTNGNMLPGQMSPWQLASFKDDARILALKFG